MAKQLFFIALVLLISACTPVIEQEKTMTDKIPAQCIDSQSVCEINTEFVSFSVKFSQPQLGAEIKTELPFVIELAELTEFSQSKQGAKQRISKVSAYLEGKEMFMGKVPIFFEQSAEGTIYSAQSLLASCSEDKMVWRLWITVETLEQKQTSFVDFTSQRL
ncbi:hypothetical protein [Colwellia psychrerythraea]|uniref:Lipoprotein n=1 Tax=Colwellia psychrerythraea TaxID=28229 RepID=A0A099KK11_COLPS|nr:hypothetical protein [Colwellia psychrerythraea]KGJ89933.1 hypothetical protein GAB14E_3811 [Colwellia psychrerythraea]